MYNDSAIIINDVGRNKLNYGRWKVFLCSLSGVYYSTIILWFRCELCSTLQTKGGRTAVTNCVITPVSLSVSHHPQVALMCIFNLSNLLESSLPFGYCHTETVRGQRGTQSRGSSGIWSKAHRAISGSTDAGLNHYIMSGHWDYLEMSVRGSKSVCLLIISNVKVGFSGSPKASGSLPPWGTSCNAKHLNMWGWCLVAVGAASKIK